MLLIAGLHENTGVDHLWEYMISVTGKQRSLRVGRMWEWRQSTYWSPNKLNLAKNTGPFAHLQQRTLLHQPALESLYFHACLRKQQIQTPDISSTRKQKLQQVPQAPTLLSYRPITDRILGRGPWENHVGKILEELDSQNYRLIQVRRSLWMASNPTKVMGWRI